MDNTIATFYDIIKLMPEEIQEQMRDEMEAMSNEQRMQLAHLLFQQLGGNK